MVAKKPCWSKTSSSINSMNPLQDRVFAKLFIKQSAKKLKFKIPKALRESVWISHSGKVFERACFTPWCQNRINVFDFHTGHNVPESKGGATTLDNLIPLCARCNLSMGINIRSRSGPLNSGPLLLKNRFGSASSDFSDVKELRPDLLILNL